MASVNSRDKWGALGYANEVAVIAAIGGALVCSGNRPYSFDSSPLYGVFGSSRRCNERLSGLLRQTELESGGRPELSMRPGHKLAR